MVPTFGEKIKEARKSKNLTQKQLAEMIGAAHNSISDWENNKNKPDPDTIELLCGVLKITPNYLLTSLEDAFSPQEKALVKKYRSLDPHGQQTVDIILDRELKRSSQLRQSQERITELEAQAAAIIPLKESPTPYTLNAAHTRMDIPDSERTPELAQFDDDIMKNF